MMCTIDGESFFVFTKCMWIGDFSVFCHITDDDTGIHYITNIVKTAQCSSGNMKANKNGQLHVKVRKTGLWE